VKYCIQFPQDLYLRYLKSIKYGPQFVRQHGKDGTATLNQY